MSLRMAIASALDFREAARRRLPRFLFDYADGGSYGEVTLARNAADLAAVALRQRVLRDVSDIDLGTTLFGRRYALPLAFSPVGMAGMYRRRGERQAIRAAAARNIAFCQSTVSLCTIEEIRAASDGPLWFQLYVLKDRGFMLALIERAKAAGAEALLLTVDLPVTGSRYRDARSGMHGPGAPLRRMIQVAAHPAWAWDVGLHGGPHRMGNLEPVMGRTSKLGDFLGWITGNLDDSLTWDTIGWIREAWDGPFVIKGVLDAEDARAAAGIGADGIVVSNHGGRQLDGVPSTARALPPIAEAVGERLTVLVDGGVRSGLDVVRMLALGAHGVMMGRPWLYALATAGEAGVARLIDLVAAEMRVAMALTGVTRVGQIDRSVLVG